MLERKRGWAGFAPSVGRALGIVFLFAPLLLAIAPKGLAQVRPARALRSVEIKGSSKDWILDVRFEIPIRYLRHTPRTVGRTLRIEVEPIKLGNEPLETSLGRQSLPVPRDLPHPVVAIFYDDSIAEQPYVELQFSETVQVNAEQGDARSLRIRIGPPTKVVRQEGNSEKVDELLARSKIAIRDKQFDLAIALLRRVLESPAKEVSSESRMEAREWIALTHERKGQLAHAQAEYEAYLADHPEGPAASRVKQRLEALRTASDAPRTKLRRASKPLPKPNEKTPVEGELYGSLGARYYRLETIDIEDGNEFVATNLLADVDLTGRLEGDTWNVRGDFNGRYDFDLANDGRTDDVRISRLSVLLEDRLHGLEATIGRQRRSDSGVLGRFDGARLAAQLGSNITIAGVAGMPVERTSDSTPNLDTILGGGSIEAKKLYFEGLRGQLFVVGQEAYSMTDRVAVGGELRYSGPQSYGFVYVDYDVLFDSLNTFLASGNYRVTDDTDLRALFERRNSPVLTLRTALQGQLAEDLDALKDQFSESDIRKLAEDRTAVSWAGSVGVTHRPTDRYQLSADLSVTHFESTHSSGGVPGTDGFGPEFSGTTQLVVNDWLIDEGVGSLSLRYFEGDSFRSVSVIGYSRFRFFEDLRVLPKLRWEWRESDFQGGLSRMRPSLEFYWRYAGFLFNTEAGIDWIEPLSGGLVSPETDYFVEAGIRWEF